MKKYLSLILSIAMIAGCFMFTACGIFNKSQQQNPPTGDGTGDTNTPTDEDNGNNDINDENDDKKLVDINEYNFVRKSYKNVNNTSSNVSSLTSETVEFLTANGNNGGMVLLTGTGFKYYFSNDNWKSAIQRWSVEGLRLTNEDYHVDAGTLIRGLRVTKYEQTLSIEDAIVETIFGFGSEKRGYETTIFTSLNNVHLMSMTLTNTESTAKEWTITIPEEGYTISADKTQPSNILRGVRKGRNYYTKSAWALWSEKEINDRTVVLEPGETVEFRFTFTTNHDDLNYEKLAYDALELDKSYETILVEHRAKWDEYWNDVAYIVTPDEEINELYYRSVYWNLVQGGYSNSFQPENAFAGFTSDYSEAWGGHPFTYGASGISIATYLMNGRSDLARNYLDLLYNPEVLESNAKLYTNIDGALSFAHERDINGNEIAGEFWGSQRHIDGFVASMFRMYYQYNPQDTEFFENRVYPVFRGVAQFYRGNLTWSDEYQAYIFPAWLSLSEGSATEPNALDIVMNAIFVMKQAADYARELGVDEEYAAEWDRLADLIYIPQNDDIYTQHISDTGTAEGGAGYFGKRAQIYLGTPYLINNGLLDIEKAKNTLINAWELNNRGDGMISFIAGWNAKTAATFEMGDLALEMLKRYFDCNPDFISEDSVQRPYFQSHYFYVQALHSMLVQGDSDVIRTFVAVPSTWKNITFQNITTINGVKVSGVFESGEVKNVTYYDLDGNVLYTQTNNADVSAIFNHETKKTTITIAEHEKIVVEQAFELNASINPVSSDYPVLPALVKVLASDGKTYSVPVEWEKDDSYVCKYDDGYKFYGNLVLNDLFENPDNIKAVCTVKTVWPEFGGQLEDELWMTDIEGDDVFVGSMGDHSAVVGITSEQAHTGEHSVKLVSQTDGEPYPNNCVRIGIETPIDASGYKYLVFWVYDTVALDADARYRLVSSDGTCIVEGWTPKAIKQNEWVKMIVDVEGLSLTSLKYLEFGIWNPGTRYVDDIYFTNDISDVCMTDIEGDDVFVGSMGDHSAVVGITSEQAHTGEHSVKLVSQTDGEPYPNNCVRIGIETPIDVSGYKYLVFWLYDTVALDADARYRLVSSDGTCVAQGWTPKSIKKNEWVKMVVDVENVNLTSLMYLEVGIWNPGTRYIDDIYFTNNPSEDTRLLDISCAASISINGSQLSNDQMKQADISINQSGITINTAISSVSDVEVIARHPAASVNVEIDGNCCYITVTSNGGSAVTTYKIIFE